MGRIIDSSAAADSCCAGVRPLSRIISAPAGFPSSFLAALVVAAFWLDPLPIVNGN